jgi:hypothetical protein
MFWDVLDPMSVQGAMCSLQQLAGVTPFYCCPLWLLLRRRPPAGKAAARHQALAAAAAAAAPAILLPLQSAHQLHSHSRNRRQVVHPVKKGQLLASV